MTARHFGSRRPIEVHTGRDGQPIALRWRGRWQNVRRIEGDWRLANGWWREAGETIDRRYFDLWTFPGVHLVCFQDLIDKAWYLEQIFD